MSERLGPISVRPVGDERWSNLQKVMPEETSIPAVLDALEAVLDLHRPDKKSEVDDPTCLTCRGDDYGDLVGWPCPTARAITEKLEGK